MKAKRQLEAVLNSATMLDGTGGHVSSMVVYAGYESVIGCSRK